MLNTHIYNMLQHIYLELVFSFQVLMARRLSSGMVCKEVSLGHAEELGIVLKSNKMTDYLSFNVFVYNSLSIEKCYYSKC